MAEALKSYQMQPSAYARLRLRLGFEKESAP